MGATGSAAIEILLTRAMTGSSKDLTIDISNSAKSQRPPLSLLLTRFSSGMPKHLR